MTVELSAADLIILQRPPKTTVGIQTYTDSEIGLKGFVKSLFNLSKEFYERILAGKDKYYVINNQTPNAYTILQVLMENKKPPNPYCREKPMVICGDSEVVCGWVKAYKALPFVKRNNPLPTMYNTPIPMDPEIEELLPRGEFKKSVQDVVKALTGHSNIKGYNLTVTLENGEKLVIINEE